MLFNELIAKSFYRQFEVSAVQYDLLFHRYKYTRFSRGKDDLTQFFKVKYQHRIHKKSAYGRDALNTLDTSVLINV